MGSVIKMKPVGQLNKAPKPPEGMPEEGNEIWATVCDAMIERSCLFSGDLPLVEVYVADLVLERELRRVISRDGMCYINDEGITRRHPLLVDLASVRARITGSATRLGLNPQGRKNMSAKAQYGDTQRTGGQTDIWDGVLD